MTRCAENDCVKIMCIVSCLWIIGWPLKMMLGYDDSSSLTAYYRCVLCRKRYCAAVGCLIVFSFSLKRATFISMIAPWNEFFFRNCNSIFAAVCMKVFPPFAHAVPYYI